MRRWFGNDIVRVAGMLAVAAAATAAPEPTWVQARRGEFRLELSEVGEIRAVDSQTVQAPLEWRSALQIVHLIPEGSMVQPGDTLVQFDASFLESEIAATRTQLERDEVDFERILAEQTSRRRGLENALRNAQFSYEQAQLNLEKLEYESTSKRMEAQLSLQQAEISQREAKAKLNAQAQLDSLEVAKAKLKIASGQVRLKEDFAQVRAMTLTAPRAGLVVHGPRGPDDDRKIRLGDEINPGMPVVEIPNLDQVDVVFDVHEVDRERVAVGVPLTLTLEAFPDQVHTARVTSVAELARPLESGSHVKEFAVVARIDAPHPTLRPGMTARVRLEVDVRPQVLLVPFTAIFEIDGQPVVFPRDLWPEPANIAIQAAGDMLAVVEGIEEGRELAQMPPPDRPVHPLGYARYRAQHAGETTTEEGDR